MATTAECAEDNWNRTLNINLKGLWRHMSTSIEHRPGSGLLVATTHGRSRIELALLGSVAPLEPRAAPCDVAVQRFAGAPFEAP
jgi:hypothetical protein